MTFGIVGEGPARDAIVAALSDPGVEPTSVTAADVADVDSAAVIGPAGSDAFPTANRAALASDTRWLAVEIGGLGGRSVDVEAAVTGFGPGTACYDCLRMRVVANDPTTEPSPRTGGDPTVERFAGALAGRAAVDLVEADGADVLGTVHEVPHSDRRLLPVPGCDCTPYPDRTLALVAGDRSVDAAAERAERTLDPRLGIVTEVGEAESFPTPYYLARLAETDGFSDASVPELAAGVDGDWTAAFMKALGEALERYSAGVYRDDRFVRGRETDVEAAVSPDAFVTAQAVPAPDHGEAVRWVPGTTLAEEDQVHLPAAFVHFPPPERYWRPATTTGLALGNSTVEAVLAGLYEVIERDAAMLAWYSTYEPLALVVEDDRYQTLARRASAEDLTPTALLLTQDVDVPVVCVALHRAGEWPRFATGMAASLDPADAARSALAEALQNWMELRRLGEEDAREEPGAIGRYASFPDAAQAFVDEASTVPAHRVGPDEVPTGATELAAVLERLGAAGLAAYGVRLTPPDVAAVGFEAVRVLVPAAQPLFTDRAYFGDRAQAVPGDLGFDPRLDREHHPFP